ncbi:MAG: hypothetical protein PHF86_01620 [Candidatus Nanoarchaeia archaeon]|nr:hypothetical protein [Candidatus Nanoarchaeia archaeon]
MKKIVKENLFEENFIRGKSTISGIGIGLDWRAKEIYSECKDDGTIEEEVIIEIIKYLLEQGYNSDQVKRLLFSEHMRWSYTDWRYSLSEFKKYFNKNVNQVKDFIIGKTDKGSIVDTLWMKIKPK